MGGDQIFGERREAASVLGWWLEAGVDVAVQDEPRNWLAPPAAKAKAKAPVAEPPRPEARLPETLDLFHDWLANAADVPLASPNARRVLPGGAENPEIMLIADMPSREEELAGTPIAGDAWLLMERMLAAIGLSSPQAYCASIACFHTPGVRDRSQLDACAAIARHQVGLVQPKLLLLLGNEPARALLGKPIASARGHVHKVEGVRTVATFHPRYLLKNPSEKALAWRDLLLLTEEDK